MKLKLFLILAAAWFVGMQAYNFFKIGPENARISSTIESFEDIAHGVTATDLSRAAEFAVLSAQVYGTKDEQGVIQEEWKDPACNPHDLLARWTKLPRPATVPTEPADADGAKSRTDDELQYGAWYREFEDSSVEVVLAFAGTNSMRDFRANFRWFFKLVSNNWDQYDLARTIGPFFEHQLRTGRFKGRELRLITTGHSLGGGLAQQAAYAAPGIKTVYAFDSSSVTGFYDVAAEERDRNRVGMRIYRLHERGEVLAYLRRAMKLVFPVAERDPQIIEVTFNFDRGDLIGQHSIQKLACALIEANSAMP